MLKVHKGTFQAFRGKNIQEVFSENHRHISERIKRERLERLLQLDEERYTANLTSEFTLNTPKLELDKMRNQPGEVDNQRYDPLFSRRKKIPIVIYILPYKGDGDLFRYNPTNSWLGSEEISLVDDSLTFEIIDEGDTEQIRGQRQKVVNTLQQELSLLEQEVAGYNNQLPNYIKQTLDAHKQHLLEERRRLDDLL
jgi:hypothetical protein